MGNNLPSRSESFSKYTYGTTNQPSISNVPAYRAPENEYSTPVSRTPSNVSEKSRTEKKSSSIERTSSKKEAEQKRKSPEPPKLPSRVEALYDCDGDEDDELTFVTGEIIQVTGQEDDDWWIGNIESQPHRHGCFPVIFVRSLDGAGARHKK